MDDERGYGWRMFATILIFAGIMKIFDSIWAFRAKGEPDPKDETPSKRRWATALKSLRLVLAHHRHHPVCLSPASWCSQGRKSTQLVGIVAAVIMAVSSMAWMPYFPIWALVYVGIAVAVIYTRFRCTADARA